MHALMCAISSILHSFYVGIVTSSPQSVSEEKHPDPGVENGAGEKITES